MIRFTMALRNTLRQPRRSVLLGGAIAIGVIIICLASGLTAGMESSVQNNVTLFSAGHIFVTGITASESGRAQTRVSDPTLIEKTKSMLPEAISISPTAQTQTTMVYGTKEQQIRMRGVDWDNDKLFSQNLILKQGDWQSAKADRAIILGAQSARRFGLGLGDSVLVRLSTVTGQQNVTEYKLGAVYDDTAAGGMTTAFVPLSNILSDLNMKEGGYQSLTIFLPDAAQADKLAKKLTDGLKKEGFTVTAAALTTQNNRTTQGVKAVQTTQSIQDTASSRRPLGSSTSQAAQSSQPTQPAQASQAQSASLPDAPAGGMGAAGEGGSGGGFGFFGRNILNIPAGSTVYRVSTITEMSGQMGAVLGSVRWIGITIFVIMLVLTMAGITNTYRMVLMERTSEIGMLRCIGFKRKDVFRIFVYEAAMIAVGGSLGGIVLSLPIGMLIHLIPFNPSGSLGYALSKGRLLFTPNALSSVLVCISVIAASVLAVFGPARKAARLLPVEALRKTA